MNLRRTLIHAYLYIQYGFYKYTGTGAFGPDRAVYLLDPVQSGGNRLKASLLNHHVKQFHEASCSVATVVSAVIFVLPAAAPRSPHALSVALVPDAILGERMSPTAIMSTDPPSASTLLVMFSYDSNST